jgi:hypothetical protein
MEDIISPLIYGFILKRHMDSKGIWIQRAYGFKGHMDSKGIWIQRAYGFKGHMD